MALDHYSRLQPNGYYPIVSLYLDSADLQLCQETLTAKLNRFKLRVRGYSDDPEYPLFVEIKRRLNTTILKARARIRHQELDAVLEARRVLVAHDQDSLDQFQLYMAVLGAGPKMLVRYLRKAYEAKSENRLRITFDQRLCYKVTGEPKVSLNGSGWRENPLTIGAVILEIKFTGLFPRWLTEMARALDLQSQGISKYARSIQQADALGFCPLRVRS
jgi:hypothetical protein